MENKFSEFMKSFYSKKTIDISIILKNNNKSNLKDITNLLQSPKNSEYQILKLKNNLLCIYSNKDLHILKIEKNSVVEIKYIQFSGINKIKSIFLDEVYGKIFIVDVSKQRKVSFFYINFHSKNKKSQKKVNYKHELILILSFNIFSTEGKLFLSKKKKIVLYKEKNKLQFHFFGIKVISLQISIPKLIYFSLQGNFLIVLRMISKNEYEYFSIEVIEVKIHKEKIFSKKLFTTAILNIPGEPLVKDFIELQNRYILIKFFLYELKVYDIYTRELQDNEIIPKNVYIKSLVIIENKETLVFILESEIQFIQIRNLFIKSYKIRNDKISSVILKECKIASVLFYKKKTEDRRLRAYIIDFDCVIYFSRRLNNLHYSEFLITDKNIIFIKGNKYSYNFRIYLC